MPRPFLAARSPRGLRPRRALATLSGAVFAVSALAAAPAAALTATAHLDDVLDGALASPFVGSATLTTSADPGLGVHNLFDLPDLTLQFTVVDTNFGLSQLAGDYSATTVQFIATPQGLAFAFDGPGLDGLGNSALYFDDGFNSLGIAPGYQRFFAGILTSTEGPELVQGDFGPLSAPVPAPPALGLLGVGVAALLLRGRRL